MSITEPSKVEIGLMKISSPFMRPFVYKPFVQRIGLKGNENVLDFGSGWGDESYYMAPLLTKGGRITLLDVSSQWQEVVKKRLRKFKNLEFVNADIRSAGLPDSSFDVVVVHYVLHDIPEELRPAIVVEIAKKLKPGGFVYLNEPILDRHGMLPEEVIELMTKAGLTKDHSSSTKRFFEAKFVKPLGSG